MNTKMKIQALIYPMFVLVITGGLLFVLVFGLALAVKDFTKEEVLEKEEVPTHQQELWR